MEERGDLWRPMAATALRMFYGWVLASLAGVLLGAAAGTYAADRCHANALAVPILVLLPLMAVDLVRPIAASEPRRVAENH